MPAKTILALSSARDRKRSVLQTNRWLMLFLGLGSLLLLACTETSATEDKVAPSKLATVEGSKLAQVTLTEQAATRINLQTGTVREEPFGLRGEPGPRKMVPYSSIIYDLTGATWVYVTSQPLVFQRASIRIDYIQGDTAVLWEGPDAGTPVVTVGVAELYGAETGVK